MSRIQAFNPQHVDLPVGNLAAAGTMFQGLTGTPSDIPKLGNAYNTAYQGILGFNSSLLQNQQRLSQQLGADAAVAGGQITDQFGNLVSGANQLRADATGQNAAIDARYQGLQGQVLGDIRGIGDARLQDINDQYSRDQASAMQSLASRGLGNTTVLDSITSGLQADRDRARTRLAGEIADLTAGYRSRIGMAGLADLRRGQEQGIDLGRESLGYRRQGIGESVRQQEQQVGLGRDFLNYLSGIQAPYPDASMFAALAQQAGAAGQAGADRAQLMGLLGAQQAAARDAGAGGGGGGVPAGGGFLGGTGRGLSGPEANYGGGVTYGGGPVVGTAPPPRVTPQAGPSVGQSLTAATGSVPYLGSGTAWSGGGADFGAIGSGVTGGVFGALAGMGYEPGAGGGDYYPSDSDLELMNMGYFDEGYY